MLQAAAAVTPVKRRFVAALAGACRRSPVFDANNTRTVSAAASSKQALNALQQPKNKIIMAVESLNTICIK